MRNLRGIDIRQVLGFSALVGALVWVWVPVGTLALIGFSVLILLMIRKLIVDNVSLVRHHGITQVALSACIATVCFIPIALLVAPGVAISYYVGRILDTAVLYVDALASGSAGTTTVLMPEKFVPWWGKPIEWAGFGAFVCKVQLVEKEVTMLVAAPWYLRVLAGMIRTPLLALSYMTMFWTLMLFARAYSMIFARVFVSQRTKPRFQVDSKLTTSIARQVTTNTEYQLRDDNGQAFCYHRSLSPTGISPSVCFRAAKGCFSQRLLSGLVWMHQANCKEASGQVIFAGDGKKKFLEVRLAEGEHIAIELRNVVGFTKALRFRKRWNFNLCLLAMSRAGNAVAHGPGTILFLFEGTPLVFESADDAPSVAPARLHTWDPKAEFEMHAAKGFINYFFTGCYIKPLSGELFIYGPDSPHKSGFGSSLWSFVKNCYRPI